MTEHSLLGASSAYRWLACPGSFHLSQIHPHRPSSIYAATGSLAHELIEGAVIAGEDTVDDGIAGQTWSKDGHTITIDRDMIDGVNVMMRYLDLEDSDWSKVEFRVSLDDYFIGPPPVPLFGTVDAALRDGATLEIVDYKNGSGVVVSPVENPQLLYYAAGVLREVPWADPIKLLRLTIVQPHAQGVAPIRSWEITPLDLLMWVDDVLVPGVHACAQPDAPLNPGPWCRFCPVAGHCPRLHQDAVAMAKRDFDDSDMPQKPADLARLLDQAERAQLWIDRVREYAVEQLQAQVLIPGWGLVPTRATRKWNDADVSIAGMLSLSGIDDDAIWEKRLRSPAQMEKVVVRVLDRHSWNDIADKLVETKSSGVKLAPNRKITAGEDFIDEE